MADALSYDDLPGRPTDENGKPIGTSRPYAPETIPNYVREAVSVLQLSTRRE